MPNANEHPRLEALALLVDNLNGALDGISKIIGRPANVGSVGEYIASVIFDIRLNSSATTKCYDGEFSGQSPLAGKQVNIKYFLANKGLLNLAADPKFDYYLVLAGPTLPPVSTRGSSRTWVISSVYLFDAIALDQDLKHRGSRIGIASSVRKAFWESAMIYPLPNNPRLILTDHQQQLLALFAPKPLP